MAHALPGVTGAFDGSLKAIIIAPHELQLRAGARKMRGSMGRPIATSEFDVAKLLVFRTLSQCPPGHIYACAEFDSDIKI
jgi:hypothetical protein